ncbi:hypothetical protein DV735_g3201, partial [Chaetothyriales sp. CBS 134920]
MPPRVSPASSYEVEFLLLCMQRIEGQVKWEDVALGSSGRFKSGQTARQFYNRLKDKQGKTPSPAKASGSKSTATDKCDKPDKNKKKLLTETEGEGQDEASPKQRKKAAKKGPKSSAAPVPEKEPAQTGAVKGAMRRLQAGSTGVRKRTWQDFVDLTDAFNGGGMEVEWDEWVDF